MSYCHIRIETTDAERAYAPGDEVHVVVHVTARRAFPCDAVDIQLGFETHGKGNRDSRWYSRLTLFAGRIEEGEHTFEGVLIVPPVDRRSPPTYLGHFINVEWFVRARLDVPWALDPKETLRIDVDPPEALRPFEPPSIPPHDPVELRGMNAGFLVVAALFLAAGGWFAWKGNPWAAAALLVPPGLILRRFLADRAASRRVGSVGFGVWPRTVQPGEELGVYVMLSPPDDLEVERLRVRLRAEERATSGSGTNETTHTHDAVELDRTLLERALVEARDDWEGEVRFQLPIDAPPTFSTGDNVVAWEVQLEVVPRAGKPLRATRALTVG